MQWPQFKTSIPWLFLRDNTSRRNYKHKPIWNRVPIVWLGWEGEFFRATRRWKECSSAETDWKWPRGWHAQCRKWARYIDNEWWKRGKWHLSNRYRLYNSRRRRSWSCLQVSWTDDKVWPFVIVTLIPMLIQPRLLIWAVSPKNVIFISSTMRGLPEEGITERPVLFDHALLRCRELDQFRQLG